MLFFSATPFRYLVGDLKADRPSGVASNLVITGFVYTRNAYFLSESKAILCFSFKCEKPNILVTCVESYQPCDSNFPVASNVINLVTALVDITTGLMPVIISVTRSGFMKFAFSVDTVFNRITFSNLTILLSSINSPFILLVIFKLL